MKKLLPILMILFLLLPIFSFAQGTPPSTRIVPCDGPDCGFDDLMQLLNNIIKYIILISVPIAACVIAYAGFIIMTSGVSDRISEAKRMIQKVVIGFVFVLGAWIIVNTILFALLKPEFKDLIQLG